MPVKYQLVIILLFIFCFACRQNEKPVVHELGVSKYADVTRAVGMDSILKKTISTSKEDKEVSENKKEEVLLDYDTLQWSELVRMDKSFILDLKYATTDNFVKEQMYECPRCFLRPVAATALQKIQDEFKAQGLRIKLLDCYRPAPVQQKLWDKVPNASYVTPPAKGSMHNRGLAVDLTLVNEDGTELDMGTPYDFFGRKAHHTHTDLPEVVLKNRRLLKSTMERNGFKSIRTEWWHYSYAGQKFAIDDMEWPCD